MTSQIIPVEPFDFIIFGATGDLAERKLLPALYQRQVAGQFFDPSRIIGSSRTKMSNAEYRRYAEAALKEHVKAEELDPEALKTFLERLSYVAADATTGEGFDKLKESIGKDDVIRVFYLAVAPALFGKIAQQISQNGLVNDKVRIVVEKPIGRDLESAKLLNDTIGSVFRENQIFRIDHYLGKETVQNLMALRFANALYEPLWNNPISITYRSQLPNLSALKVAQAIMTKLAHCATWCKTICCSYFASWRWKPLLQLTRIHFATRSLRFCVPSIPLTAIAQAR